MAWYALTQPEMGTAEHLSLTIRPFKVFHAYYPHGTSEKSYLKGDGPVNVEVLPEVLLNYHFLAIRPFPSCVKGL